jgi:hypothetical protein
MWLSVPAVLLGADYIQSAQDNADVNDALGTTMILEVDVADDTILHMFIDDRLSAVTPFPWMNLAGFGADWVNSGVSLLQTETNRNLGFTIWSTATPLAAGTYTFRQQPIDAGFYGIAATSVAEVPEPASMFLVGTGFAAIAAARKRRRTRR